MRTAGQWSVLDSVPVDIHQNDKVVTRRGRAEISLPDGGYLRLDLDTNVAFKIADDTRLAYVILGNVWFNIMGTGSKG